MRKLNKVTSVKSISFCLLILIQGCTSTESVINVQDMAGKWDCLAHLKSADNLALILTYSSEMTADGVGQSEGIASFYSSEFPSAKLTFGYQTKIRYKLKKDTITFATTDFKITNIIEDSMGIIDDAFIQEIPNHFGEKEKAKVVMKNINSIEYKDKDSGVKNSCVRAKSS